jgi:hypothetical protein
MGCSSLLACNPAIQASAARAAAAITDSSAILVIAVWEEKVLVFVYEYARR